MSERETPGAHSANARLRCGSGPNLNRIWWFWPTSGIDAVVLVRTQNLKISESIMDYIYQGLRKANCHSQTTSSSKGNIQSEPDQKDFRGSRPMADRPSVSVPDHVC